MLLLRQLSKGIMRPNLCCHSSNSSNGALSVSLLLLFVVLCPLRAQTITSDPANGANGVSVSAAVTFPFSSAVDPTTTSVTFLSQNPPAVYPATTSWNSGN